LLPKSVFTQLYQTNDQFAVYFDSNLSKRQALLEAAQNLGEFILPKVDDSIYHPVLVLSPDEPLNAVTRLMKEQSIDSALVQLNQEDPRLDATPSPYPYGIITRTNMLHAVMLDGCALNTPVGDIYTYPVFYAEEDDFLFNAMITMTRNRMKRVMVCNGEQPVGMLDMTQILSSFSTQSHVLSLSIARAQSIDELAIAASRQ
jgi:CBS domain-containing protein